jgi:hypothetical protein
MAVSRESTTWLTIVMGRLLALLAEHVIHRRVLSLVRHHVPSDGSVAFHVAGLADARSERSERLTRRHCDARSGGHEQIERRHWGVFVDTIDAPVVDSTECCRAGSAE